MANLVVTSTTNTIKVDFNDTPLLLSRDEEPTAKGAWLKTHIAHITLATTMIMVKENDGFEWQLSHDGADGTLTVDSVDGVAPTSLDDLYTKLIALIA